MAGLRSAILACLHHPRIKAHSARERAYRCFKQTRLMELPPIWKHFFCVIGLQSDHQSHLQGICSISYYTTLSTISAFPTTDHCNCVDVSKCYLACTDRARNIYRSRDDLMKITRTTITSIRHLHNVGPPLAVCVPQNNSF